MKQKANALNLNQEKLCTNAFELKFKRMAIYLSK